MSCFLAVPRWSICFCPPTLSCFNRGLGWKSFPYRDTASAALQVRRLEMFSSPAPNKSPFGHLLQRLSALASVV